MNFFKLVLALVVLFLAAFGALALLGLIVASLKYLVFFGLLLLAGALGYRALTRKSDEPLIEPGWPERELEQARQAIEGFRRRQLTK